MATLTNPGSRMDLLVTLGRLALPDAVKRGDQAPVAALGLALFYLVIATASTLGLLPLLFSIEDDGLRRTIAASLAVDHRLEDRGRGPARLLDRGYLRRRHPPCRGPGLARLDGTPTTRDRVPGP